MKRRILAGLLLLCLALCLIACGKKNEAGAVELSDKEGETVEGWIPSKITFPDWLAGSTGWETNGDTIYYSGYTPDKQLVAAAYSDVRSVTGGIK